MIAPLIVLVALAGVRTPIPNDTTPCLTIAADSASRHEDPRIDRVAAPLDTPVVRRPLAVEYSDAYYTRLTIHRIGSYTMLPLFAAEYSLGQNLIQDASPPTWMKPTHALVAGGIGVLFGINTITGVWNLWDSRNDSDGRTRRIVHSVLMLASDAGFAAAGATAPGHHDHFVDYGTYLHRERVHRGIAIGSIAASTIGGVMMWFWK
jgi:hypothetical protein